MIRVKFKKFSVYDAFVLKYGERQRGSGEVLWDFCIDYDNKCFFFSPEFWRKIFNN